LLIHTTDTSVKPIIGNKEIEKIAELTYNHEALKFETVSVDKLTDLIDKNIENEEIPALSALYTAIS